MKRNCRICGREFETRWRTSVCEDCRTGVCAVCGKTFTRKYPYNQKTCSSECRNLYIKESGIAKERADKAKETLQLRYGVSNPRGLQDDRTYKKICRYCGKEFETHNARQVYCKGPHYGKCPVCGKQVEIRKIHLGPATCSKECQQLLRYSTNIKRYGCKDAINSEHGRQVAKETCLKKYGVEHYSKTDEFKERYKQTMLDRYGVTAPLDNKDIKNKIRKTNIKKYGVPYTCMRMECRSKYRTASKTNDRFSELLDSKNIEYEIEFPVEGYSYDFKVNNTLIEIDPTITHNSELSVFNNSSPKDEMYHLEKTKSAQRNGFRCIHVWDWDDWSKVIMLIENRTLLNADDCLVHSLNKDVSSAFADKYDLSGKDENQIMSYGLYADNELVEIIAFSSCNEEKYDFELSRCSILSGVSVSGGMRKLFNQFIKDHPDRSVVAYCDRSKFTGSMYESAGMVLSKSSLPQRIWSKNKAHILDTDCVDDKQVMLNNGWLPVFDCGQLIYEYFPKSRK